MEVSNLHVVHPVSTGVIATSIAGKLMLTPCEQPYPNILMSNLHEL